MGINNKIIPLVFLNTRHASKPYPLFILFFIYFTFSVLTCQASNHIPPNSFISFYYQNGSILAHHKEMEELILKRTHSYKLEIGRKMSGLKKWHQNYHLPELGIGLSYNTLSNKEVYGEAFNTYFFINQNLLNISAWNLSYQMGIGVAYINRTFNETNNPFNQNISYPINAFLRLGFYLKYHINNSLSTQIGASLEHYSNGKTKIPNWGLNIFNYQLGISYFLSEPTNYSSKEKQNIRLNHLKIIYSWGYNEKENRNYKKFLNTSLSLSYERKIGAVNSLGLGTDLTFDEAPYEIAKNSQANSPFKEGLDLGLHLGYTQYFGNIHLVIQIGHYLFESLDVNHFYHKLGLHFKVNSFLIANLSLRTHWGKAHCIEYGLGYYFNR